MVDIARTELLKRALDAAIGAMRRNRALLFAINLVVAVVLITIYLENESFDDKQRQGHLVALHRIAEQLIELRLIERLDDDRLGEPSKLGLEALRRADEKPEPWRNLTIAGERVSTRRSWLTRVGSEISRLHVVSNELGSVRLPQGQLLPVGITVPQNDFVPVAGILLLVMYSWLLFSFRQLGAIIARMKEVLEEASDSSDQVGRDEHRGVVRDIIEFHFLFRTSKGGPAALFVKALYYSPPVVMFLALVNDLNSIRTRTGDWKDALQLFATFRMSLLVGLTVALAFVAYQVREADKTVNVVSFGKEKLKK